ncbi:MAG: NAD-dependent epimerase/dehydratase family protein [Gemmataceae bacterium]
MFADEKVLVTGGAGLIGAALVRRLAAEGAQVRAVVHRRRPPEEEPGVDYLHADLTRAEDCAIAVAGVRYVIHCAASTSGAFTTAATPMVHVTPNVIMNSLLLEAAHAARVDKFLWLSSTVGYPDASHPVREEEFLTGEPFDKYYFAGWAKRFGEVLCRMYSDKLRERLTTIVLRPTNVYGPGDKFDPARSHVTAALIRKVVERQSPIEVWGTGNDVRDLIYLDDFVEACLLALERLDSFTPLNIGSGRPCTVRQILQTILACEDWQDAEVVYAHDKPTMIPVRLVDTRRAEELLGFRARTGLREGIQQTIDWYRQTRRAEEVACR